MMAGLDWERSVILLSEGDMERSGLPVGFAPAAFLRTPNGESVRRVGGIVVGGHHAPELVGVIAVFFAEIMGEARRVYCQPWTTFRAIALALYYLRCAGLVHLVRVAGQSCCIGESRLEFLFSRGAAVDVVDFQPAQEVNWSGLDGGGDGQQGKCESRGA